MRSVATITRRGGAGFPALLLLLLPSCVEDSALLLLLGEATIELLIAARAESASPSLPGGDRKAFIAA
jgi:hypothetical protein